LLPWQKIERFAPSVGQVRLPSLPSVKDHNINVVENALVQAKLSCMIAF